MIDLCSLKSWVEVARTIQAPDRLVFFVFERNLGFSKHTLVYKCETFILFAGLKICSKRMEFCEFNNSSLYLQQFTKKAVSTWLIVDPLEPFVIDFTTLFSYW